MFAGHQFTFANIKVQELSDSGLKTEFAEDKFVITKSGSKFSTMALDQSHEQI